MTKKETTLKQVYSQTQIIVSLNLPFIQLCLQYVSVITIFQQVIHTQCSYTKKAY